MLRNLFIQLHNTVISVLPVFVVFSFFVLIEFSLGIPDSKSYLYSFGITLFLGAVLYTVMIRWSLINFSFFVKIWTPRLVTIIAFGLLLRSAWSVVFDVKQVSDMATYVQLANMLIESNQYSIGDTKAYWPAGFPLFLATTHFFYFEVNNFTINLLNLLLYVVGSVLLYNVGNKLYDSRVARMAVLLFSIWPTNFTVVGFAMKEALVLVCLLAAVWCYLGKNAWYQHLKIGLCLGLAVLIQPGVVLFFTVFVVTSWYRKLSVKKQSGQLALMLLGIAIVIAPWSVRNYEVFHQYVMVSTNGGSNLFRANNSVAHGGYLEYYLPDVEKLDEVAKDTEYKRLAKEWILEHPTEFAVLMFRKMNLFLGDDSVGVYQSLKIGAISAPSAIWYLVAKMLSNFYWMLLWLMIGFSLHKLRAQISYKPETLVITLSFLYFFVVHTVFESNAKYHFVVMWAVALLAAAVFHQKDSVPNS